MTTAQRLTKIKIQLLIRQPWFGQLACYMIPQETSLIETAGVDERGMFFYNKEFVSKLTDKELMGLICHEIMHLAYQHPFRIKLYDREIYNIAADIKVNNDIVKQNDISLPKVGIIPNGWNEIQIGDICIKDIHEKTSEMIYAELKKNIKTIKLPQIIFDLISGSGQQGDDGKGKGQNQLAKQLKILADKFPVSQAEKKRLQREWKERIIATNQTQKGNIPGGLKSELEVLEAPQLPWYQILLQRWKSRQRKHSWRKVNKRYFPFYFPATVHLKQLKAVVAFDTSGSMSDDDLRKALTELYYLGRKFKNLDIDVLMCDCKIHTIMKMNNQNRSKFRKLTMDGRGGTDFRPVFDWIKKQRFLKLDCLIYFSDGCGDFPAKDPGYDVIWITQYDSSVEFPFGRVLKIK